MEITIAVVETTQLVSTTVSSVILIAATAWVIAKYRQYSMNVFATLGVVLITHFLFCHPTTEYGSAVYAKTLSTRIMIDFTTAMVGLLVIRCRHHRRPKLKFKSRIRPDTRK